MKPKHLILITLTALMLVNVRSQTAHIKVLKDELKIIVDSIEYHQTQVKINQDLMLKQIK